MCIKTSAKDDDAPHTDTHWRHHNSETSVHIELIKWYCSQSSNDHWISSHTLSKRQCPIDKSLQQESFLKSNYMHLFALHIISKPFLFISVQDMCVCVLCVYALDKMNGCKGSMCVFWIIYQSKSRGGVASPCLRHRGTPLDRMSLLVLLSHKAHLCQMLNQTWRDSCWVSSHIYRSTFYHFCICSSAVLNNLPYSAGRIDI